MSIVSAERRRELPDEPGVYLFHDARGKVIYVGKAVSIKKRVASHFSNPSTRAGRDLLPMIDHIEALVVHTESEALIVEQNFIRQYQPRFNIRLRDDKSYPYIAISLDEDFPRVYFTRERHRRDRAYFGPFSSAKRTRATLEVLGKVFLFRSPWLRRFYLVVFTYLVALLLLWVVPGGVVQTVMEPGVELTVHYGLPLLFLALLVRPAAISPIAKPASLPRSFYVNAWKKTTSANSTTSSTTTFFA